MQFRLMTGDHVVSDVKRAPDGRVVSEQSRLINAGAVVESDTDLCAAFNRPGTRPKFEQLHAGAPQGGHVFDPKVETIESFAHRMKQLSGQAPAAPPTVVTPLPFPQEKMQPGRGTDDAPARVTAPAAVQTSPHLPVSSTLSGAQVNMMSADQLRAHCDGEEIPYDPAADRAKLVEIIRAFQGDS